MALARSRNGYKRSESFLENAAGQSGIEVLLISTKLYFRASYNPDNTRHCFLPDFSPRRSRFTRYPLPRARFIRGLFTTSGGCGGGNQRRFFKTDVCVCARALAPHLPPFIDPRDKFEITAHRVLSYNAIPTVHSLSFFLFFSTPQPRPCAREIDSTDNDVRRAGPVDSQRDGTRLTLRYVGRENIYRARTVYTCIFSLSARSSGRHFRSSFTAAFVDEG